MLTSIQVSCPVAVTHVLKDGLGAGKLRSHLQGDLLPIFENSVGSAYRLTTAQVTLNPEP